MNIIHQCSRCGSSAPTDRQLAEICPCNMMDRSRPSFKLVLVTIALLSLIAAIMLYATLQIPN